MLHACVTPQSCRIKGQHALVKSLTLLLLRGARFGEHQTTTDSERAWTGRLFDRFEAALKRRARA